MIAEEREALRQRLRAAQHQRVQQDAGPRHAALSRHIRAPEEEIIFVEGIAHPIKCSKIRYYKDGFFKARLKERAPVKTIELNDM